MSEMQGTKLFGLLFLWNYGLDSEIPIHFLSSLAQMTFSTGLIAALKIQ